MSSWRLYSTWVTTGVLHFYLSKWLTNHRIFSLNISFNGLEIISVASFLNVHCVLVSLIPSLCDTKGSQLFIYTLFWLSDRNKFKTVILLTILNLTLCDIVPSLWFSFAFSKIGEIVVLTKENFVDNWGIAPWEEDSRN